MSTETFNLEISDPVLLLNEIAKRYDSTSRILMEYVDNALDDAEELFQENGGAYPRPIRIKLHINTRRSIVTITDNCRGMNKDSLKGIVQHIGESGKRGCTWVNGRFGFGVHAFRAAASRIKFHTKHAFDDGVVLQFHRDQHHDLQPPQVTAEDFPTDTGTGTVVCLGPLDSEWRTELNAANVRREIESHFERLLARDGLTIVVQEDDHQSLTCQPFSYEGLAGTDFQRTLTLEVEGETYPIEVALKVSDVPVPDRRPRFFLRGRRINDVKNIRTFIKKSRHRTSVWGHDHLVGFIEVGEVVSPVITRDDFERTRLRALFYDAILQVEDELREALDTINRQQEDQSLGRLESVLRRVLSGLAREDALKFRTEVIGPGNDEPVGDHGGAGEHGQSGDPGVEIPEASVEPNRDTESDGGSSFQEGAEESVQESGEADGETPNVTGPDSADGPAVGNENGGFPLESSFGSGRTAATRRKSGFDIKFMDLPVDAEGVQRRSRLLDGTIIINVGHDDFKSRLDHSRHGRARVSERLVSYLANVISIHYKDQYYDKFKNQPERLDQLFDEQVDFVCRLESGLRPHVSLLQERMEQDTAEVGEDDQQT